MLIMNLTEIYNVNDEFNRVYNVNDEFKILYNVNTEFKILLRYKCWNQHPFTI
jgi:hypothetical protein